MDQAEIDLRFDHHPPDDARARTHRNIREYCKLTAAYLDAEIGECREKSLAITHLEETMFWANAAIARGH